MKLYPNCDTHVFKQMVYCTVYCSLLNAGKPEESKRNFKKILHHQNQLTQKDLVNWFSNYNSIQSFTISVDCYFTSVLLADWPLVNHNYWQHKAQPERNSKRAEKLERQRGKSVMRVQYNEKKILMVFY